jgi:hypothetical protein
MEACNNNLTTTLACKNKLVSFSFVIIMVNVYDGGMVAYYSSKQQAASTSTKHGHGQRAKRVRVRVRVKHEHRTCPC